MSSRDHCDVNGMTPPERPKSGPKGQDTGRDDDRTSLGGRATDPDGGAHEEAEMAGTHVPDCRTSVGLMVRVHGTPAQPRRAVNVRQWACAPAFRTHFDVLRRT